MRRASLPAQNIKLALIRPIPHRFDQTRPHGIGTDVIPFLIITFTAPQPMMPARPLPRAGIRHIQPAEAAFPIRNPNIQPHINIHGRAKKMKVVRHQHITPHDPRSGALPNLLERSFNGHLRQPGLAVLGANRHKDNGRLRKRHKNLLLRCLAPTIHYGQIVFTTKPPVQRKTGRDGLPAVPIFGSAMGRTKSGASSVTLRHISRCLFNQGRPGGRPYLSGRLAHRAASKNRL